MDDKESERLREIAERCDPGVLTDSDANAIVTADEMVKKRTYYGMRAERASKPSVILTWSNGGRQWLVDPNRIEPETDVSIDANQILVPFSSVRMNRVLPCVIDHPLYFGSLEAWARDDIVEQKTAIMVWASGQIERMGREKWEEGE